MAINQTYEDRGKLAFVQDQAAAAVAAFQQGEFKDCETILRSIGHFIQTWVGLQVPN